LNEIIDDAVQNELEGRVFDTPFSDGTVCCECTKHESIFNGKQGRYFVFTECLVCGVYYLHGTVVTGNKYKYSPMTDEELQRTNLENACHLMHCPFSHTVL
jgi:translation initiation factor 2 beta subunit (eIF-2beta)/eIF-5